eukprot:3157506-Rhodomonas_salina.1
MHDERISSAFFSVAVAAEMMRAGSHEGACAERECVLRLRARCGGEGEAQRGTCMQSEKKRNANVRSHRA